MLEFYKFFFFWRGGAGGSGGFFILVGLVFLLLWFAFFCLFVLTQKEKLEVPHRKVMLCATSSGDRLKS